MFMRRDLSCPSASNPNSDPDIVLDETQKMITTFHSIYLHRNKSLITLPIEKGFLNYITWINSKKLLINYFALTSFLSIY